MSPSFGHVDITWLAGFLHRYDSEHEACVALSDELRNPPPKKKKSRGRA